MDMEFDEMPNSKLIEPRFKGAIDRYVEHGIPPGDFITAVLENNLTQAFGRADTKAVYNMKHIICYIYNEIPGSCWGSKVKMAEWYKTIKEKI